MINDKLPKIFWLAGGLGILWCLVCISAVVVGIVLAVRWLW